MLTIIAALYVVLPALYALACCALATSPIRFDEPVCEAPAANTVAASTVFAIVRDESARKAVDALHMASKQSNESARRIWLDVALVYKHRSEAYNAAIAA